ncbi:acyl-CoA N-acyltransferase, partial [Pterulicium gracile]
MSTTTETTTTLETTSTTKPDTTLHAYRIETFPENHESMKECHKIRFDVFHREQGFPLDPQIDTYELDAPSQHFLLRLVDGEKPIGTIRGTHRPYPELEPNAYKLSQLAILEEHRKTGWGGVLVDALHEWVKDDAKERGIRLGGELVVRLVSQVRVRGFYEKYGYEP